MLDRFSSSISTAPCGGASGGFCNIGTSCSAAISRLLSAIASTALATPIGVFIPRSRGIRIGDLLSQQLLMFLMPLHASPHRGRLTGADRVLAQVSLCDRVSPFLRPRHPSAEPGRFCRAYG